MAIRHSAFGILSSLGISSFVIFGCSPPAITQVADAPGSPPVGPPQRLSLKRVVEQPGRVEALAQTPIYAKIAGFVSAWHKDFGDSVEAGTPLAEISVPELDQELVQKQAAMAQMTAEVRQAKMLLEAAEANTRSAGAAVAEAEAGRARAKANYDRWQSESKRAAALFAGKVIDEQNRDEAVFQFRAAEAALTEVEAKVRSAEALRVESDARRGKAAADVTVAEAKERVAKADEARTRALLGYTRIVAPFKGIVTARHVDVGHFLQPNASGEPLFVVTQVDPVRVWVEVPEMDAPWVKAGDPADVRVQALRGRVVPGKVTRTAWALSDVRSRTLKTAIDLANPDGELRPGMYAYAAVTVTLPPTWTLPAAAVVRQGDATSAFLVRDGKAVRVGIQTGQSDAGRVEVFRIESPPGSGRWTDVTATETFMLKAAGVTDGQGVK
ncbi:MAG TPA: efflux RND transporter periplasmic adaptor subunit [Gemmataceae bacterium]|jgi:multidrug efflux pump subunit AcrA (membrane-fusion protein)|nr:efflux RND transporter periplasmic adaptor subunit [Gemmataceae bacterium]